MKSKTFVMMFLAIGCGLVAAYLTARISAKQATPDTQPVLVAKEKINAGQVIKEPEKLFVVMSYPTGSTPNAISNFDDLKNKIVNKTVQAGQWLTPDDITGNFGIELPKGYYAMAVKVDATSAASGFILPKSRVNVVATIKASGMQGRPKVVTILQDVLVLAMDTTAVRPEDKMAFGQVNNALLAVKPADSQKLALAQSMGEIRLVLRSHDDDAKAVLPVQEYTEPDQLGAEGATVPSVKPQPTFKLIIAKQDLEAGTSIDEPEKYFIVRSFFDNLPGAVPEAELDKLKGKTLKHTLFKDAVVTAKYFQGQEIARIVEKTVDLRHVLFIQNGGQAPLVHTYKNGMITQPDEPTEKLLDKDRKPTEAPAGTSTGETGKTG
jgi:pilus assembly protein CpaB